MHVRLRTNFLFPAAPEDGRVLDAWPEMTHAWYLFYQQVNAGRYVAAPARLIRSVFG
jgi:hypothetical protein